MRNQNASGRDGRRGRQQKKRMETGTGRHMTNCTINFKNILGKKENEGMPESEKNRACWNCWYDEFCDWHPAGDEDACEEFVPEEEE